MNFHRFIWGLLWTLYLPSLFAATAADRTALQALISEYRERAASCMDTDSLCIPVEGQAERAEVIVKLGRAFVDSPRELLPLVYEVLARDPAPLSRQAAYQIFGRFPESTKDEWTASVYEILIDENRRSNRMENSLRYRAALAVHATYFELPATEWNINPEIQLDLGNIDRALRVEGFEIDLTYQYRRRSDDSADPDCVTALLNRWANGENLAERHSEAQSPR